MARARWRSEWERTLEELDESDIRACGGYLPLGGTGLASGTLGETEDGTGLAGGTLVEGSDVDAGFGGVLPETGETASGESVTNEANFDEKVNLSNFFKDIGVTTNSGVDSGLDKGEIDHDFDGGEADGDAKCGEGLRVPRPAAVGGEAAADGGRRQGAGMKTRSVREAAPTQSVGARGIENSSSERGGTSQTRRAAATAVGEPHTTVCGDSFPVRRPPTAACGGTSPTRQRFFAVN